MRRVTKLLTVLGSISTVAIFTGWYFSRVPEPANADTQPGLTCTFSGEYWNGDKVYTLENNSTLTLTHLTIMSWSEQILPILKIAGSKAVYVPNNKESALSPPRELMPHQKVWFVGPRALTTSSAETFSVIWQNNSKAYYETVKDIS